jgi:hypothetical protein
LEAWAETPEATTFFSSIITFGPRTLLDYLQAAGFKGPRSAIAPNWIKSWGLDLASFGRDRTQRNYASYAPSIKPLEHTETEYYKLLYKTHKTIWELLFPPTFVSLDQHLVYDAVLSFFTTQNKSTAAEKTEKVFLSFGINKKVIEKLNEAKDWRAFQNVIAPPVNANPSPIQMLGRASLLHRLAIGASVDLIKKTSYETVTKRLLENHFKQKLHFVFDEAEDLDSDIRDVLDTKASIATHPVEALTPKERNLVSQLSAVSAWSFLAVES